MFDGVDPGGDPGGRPERPGRAARATLLGALLFGGLYLYLRGVLWLMSKQ